MNQLTIPCTVKIVGEAGDGIISASDILQYSIYLYGLYSSSYREFPSNIQGGYTASVIRISATEIRSPLAFTDVCVLHCNQFQIPELSTCNTNALLILSNPDIDIEDVRSALKINNRTDIKVLYIPGLNTASEIKHSFPSFIAGVLGTILQIPRDMTENSLRYFYEKKSSATIDTHLDICTAGSIQAVSVVQNYTLSLPAPSLSPAEYSIIDGNSASGRGALYAGCTFFASYPITPSTSIGSWLASNLPESGGYSHQAEDEIAAIGAAIGASFAGAKSMTATSGPGLSLMQEFIGYASMTELPLVIIDVQRAGPSTGSPTKFGQEDLFAACFGSHGESPRIVLSPIDTEDCFLITLTAFDLAEQYQCPVIVLSDSILAFTKNIIHKSHFKQISTLTRDILTIKSPDSSAHGSNLLQQSTVESSTTEPGIRQGFQRYKNTPNGLNPLPVPGRSKAAYCCTGIEHDESGFPTDSSHMRTIQQQKRFRKLSPIESEHSELVNWDIDKSGADLGIIAWGVTASVVKDTISLLRAQHIKATALFPRLLFPVCVQSLNRLAGICKEIVVVESNFNGQFAKLLRMYTDIRPHSLTSQSGIPFTPEQLFLELSTIVATWKK